ncbi:MAG: outer membrane beta-barrel protein [Pseudomonadota bacterium]
MRTFVTLCLLLAAGSTLAQSPRAGDFEYTIGIAYSIEQDFDGRNGSFLTLETRTGFQGGFDYYVTDRLTVGFDATWVRPRYDAQLVPEDGEPAIDISHRASIFSGQFNGSYYFTDNPVKPYVEGGLGWTYFDSNVSSDSPITGCWWDPWWGYICDTFYTTYNDTSFSYGVGLGLRWDYNRNLYFKGGYRWLEVEFNNVRDKPMLENASLEIGFKF